MARKPNLEDVLTNIEALRTELRASARGLCANSEAQAVRIDACASALRACGDRNAEALAVRLDAVASALHSDGQQNIDESRRLHEQLSVQMDAIASALTAQISAGFDRTNANIEGWGARILTAISLGSPLLNGLMLVFSTILGLFHGIWARVWAIAEEAGHYLYDQNGAIIMDANNTPITILERKFTDGEAALLGVLVAIAVAAVAWLIYAIIAMIVNAIRRNDRNAH